MQIISWNVNGIRACLKKGTLQELIKQAKIDVICMQEIKATEQDIDFDFTGFGYQMFVNSAQKKGYSGVGVLTRIKPNYVNKNIGIEKFDTEGRILELGFDDFVLFNVYFPNGQKDDERLNYKLEFYAEFFKYCENLRKNGKNLVICGDYNTAHKEIDLARPKQNENTSGFLKIEREWLDKIIDMGYVDTFRNFNKEPENYSWWSYKFSAREKNIGWRIDYFFVNREFLNSVKKAFIMKDILGSDHAPVGIEINQGV